MTPGTPVTDTTSTGVNPREVKRYINAYTLQRKISPALDADVVLCLQTLAFRDVAANAPYEVVEILTMREEANEPLTPAPLHLGTRRCSQPSASRSTGCARPST